MDGWINRVVSILGFLFFCLGVVKELTVYDKMPITWSSHDSMVFAVNDQMRSVEYVSIIIV